jgi:hypothetical protein
MIARIPNIADPIPRSIYTKVTVTVISSQFYVKRKTGLGVLGLKI